MACIHALLRRQGGQVNTLMFGNTGLDLDAHALCCGGKIMRLSAKEFDVMRLLMQAGEKNVPKEVLLARVWGYETSAVENNVEVYVGFLRKKLKALGSNVAIGRRPAGGVSSGGGQGVIRRLRLKFICVNMAIVLVMMALMTVAVLYFTQRSLARESLHAMQQIAMDPFRPQAPGEAADGVRLPLFCFGGRRNRGCARGRRRILRFVRHGLSGAGCGAN